MNSVKFLGVLLVLILSTTTIMAANAAWNSTIKVSRNIIFEGQEVEFTATLKISGGEMQNLKIQGGVDNQVIYDRILYYFQNNTEYPYSFKWKATGGSHKVFFTVQATDSISPDQNPNDNRVEKQITIRPGLTKPGGIRTDIILPSPPTGPFTSATATGINVQFKPCTMYQQEPTDLDVFYFSIGGQGENTWTYTAKVQNKGRRCIKSFQYKVTNVNKIMVEKTYGNPTGPNFILGENGTLTITGTFINDGNFIYSPSGNNKIAKFTFEIDPNNLIPDPNRSNNKKDCEILMTW